MFVHTINWATEKPPLGSQIDWGHPLSQGLVGCWLMNEGGGNKVSDMARGNNGTNVGAIWKPLLTGIGLNFNGSSSYIDCGFPNARNFGTAPFTICASLRVSTTTSAYDRKIITNDDEADATRVMWILQINENDDANAAVRNCGQFVTYNAGTIDKVSTTTVMTDGNWYNFVGLRDGTNLKLYLNGKFNASVTDNKINVTNTSAPLTIGKSINGTSGGAVPLFNGDMQYIYLFNRALSPPEIQQLYEAPYQIIQPIKRRTYFQISGEPPVTATTGIMTPRTNYWGDL